MNPSAPFVPTSTGSVAGSPLSIGAVMPVPAADGPATPRGLNSANPSSTDATHSPLDDDSLRNLMCAAARCDTRDDSLAELARTLAEILPGTAVRTAVGGGRLAKFFDSRLGWLGTESELFNRLAGRWQSLIAGPTSNLHEHNLILRLSKQDSAKHALVWLSGREVDGLVQQRLTPWIDPLAAIIWGRPRWSPSKVLRQAGGYRRVILAAAVLVTAIAAMPYPYRVACTVTVDALAPRVVSSPFEATIQDVHVHPGDLVRRGQTLVRLDGRPLRLERESLASEIQQTVKQKDIAMAAGRVADAQLSALRVQQLTRQIELIDRRLGQLAVTSPIDGIIVTGDLRRAVGTPFEIGKVMMEIAPLERLLVEIEIPEYEISMIRAGSPARVRIDAAGMPTLDCEVTEIRPAADLRNEQVVFVAPLEIANTTAALRPGMTGKATLYGPRRPLIWPYLRKIVDQLTWLIGM